jgi:hypothetical protein
MDLLPLAAVVAGFTPIVCCWQQEATPADDGWRRSWVIG